MFISIIIIKLTINLICDITIPFQFKGKRQANELKIIIIICLRVIVLLKIKNKKNV